MNDTVARRYIRELLKKLDAEHSHVTRSIGTKPGQQFECETCFWLAQQPEWQAMKTEQTEP